MYKKIDSEDQKLIEAAVEVLRRNYQEPRHTVGAAILTESGKIYAAINVDSCGYGPCAEPIAIGSAISNGERNFKKIVAVSNINQVISPCGNFRQLLLDYAPNTEVILLHNGELMKVAIENLLPDSYRNFE